MVAVGKFRPSPSILEQLVINCLSEKEAEQRISLLSAIMELLEKMTTSDAASEEIQEELLREILTRNANAEYLKSFLNGSSDKQLFRKNVPVVEYQDIKPYVDRIANGDPSQILTAEPITELLLSSGTSGGNRKMIPTTAEEPKRRACYSNLAASILSKHIQFWDQGKQMNFRFVMPETTTSGGLILTNVVSSNFRRSRTQNRSNCWSNDTSPDEVILCEDIKQSMYCQLLCGLLQRDTVVRIGTTYASGFLRIIRFLEEHWQELCSNIRTGHVSDWITDLSCRKAVSSILNQKIPDLADSVEVECRKSGSWKGIIRRLWPRTTCIEVVSTGSMTQYIPRLEFYCYGIPLVSMYYAASEGFFGLNTKPLINPYHVCYTLVPWLAYYEFLPLDHEEITGQDHMQEREPNCSSDSDHLKVTETVDLANVQIGQRYELVVTTFTGLYRYRLGDVLMVTDFHNNSPQFKVLQRRNVVLSIDMDKTAEEDLSQAVSRAMQILEPHGYLLADYSAYADTSSFPGHYVLFWELQMREKEGLMPVVVLDRDKMEECCNIVEESLDGMYKVLRRRRNVIDPLEIRVVKAGTFDGVMELSVSEGASLNQYKTPKCIKSEKAIQFLNSVVVDAFFSQVLPN